MQSAQNKSKTKIFIAFLIVFATIVIIGGAVYAVVQISTQANKSGDSKTSSDGASGKTVTQQSLNQGRNDVSESVKQAKEAHSQAEAAVNDASKRVKVSE